MRNFQRDKERMINNKMSDSLTVLISSREAAGYILGEDLISPIDLPPFDQSATDGYAVKLNPPQLSFCQLIHEIRTGTYQSFRIEKKSMVRIGKGDHVPPGTYCIISGGNIISRKNCITVKSLIPGKGDNILFKGSYFKQGDPVLSKGTRLHEASVRLLLSLGIDSVKVQERSSESSAAVSDEFKAADRSLLSKKIPGSGTSLLTAIFKKIHTGIHKFFIRRMVSPK